MGDGRGKLLVIEDDVAFVDAVACRFQPREVRLDVHTGSSFVVSEQIGIWDADVALVGLSVEGLDALDFFRRVRVHDYRTILFACSPCVGGVEAVLAYEAGADDYFAKTTDLTLIEAKLKSALRRARQTPLSSSPRLPPVETPPPQLSSLLQDGVLTRFEERLLRTLYRAEGKVVSNTLLRQELWRTKDVDPKLLYEHISTLRSKLKSTGWNVVNSRGKGYAMRQISG